MESLEQEVAEFLSLQAGWTLVRTSCYCALGRGDVVVGQLDIVKYEYVLHILIELDCTIVADLLWSSIVVLVCTCYALELNGIYLITTTLSILKPILFQSKSNGNAQHHYRYPR